MKRKAGHSERHVWTDDEIAVLVKEVGLGKTPSEIQQQLSGVTTNQISSKISNLRKAKVLKPKTTEIQASKKEGTLPLSILHISSSLDG